jgi:hypothetical protein
MPYFSLRRSLTPITWPRNMHRTSPLFLACAATTPYDFHIDGKFSHGGIDIFQLLKADSGWTMTGGTYTASARDAPTAPLDRWSLSSRTGAR